MGQETSALWKELVKRPGTERRYKFIIDGVEYGDEAEVTHSADPALFEDFGIGNAHCATLDLTLYAESIPRGATIRRYLKLVNNEQETEWLPKGVFFINKRASDDGLWEIEAFDAMRRADRVWEPDQSLTFPMAMTDVVDIFCTLMDVELDSRTALDSAYAIDYPANDYTVRDILCYIAAAHGGNWVITDAGKLRLIPLLSAPVETYYLVDGAGDEITFGGVRVIV